MSNTSIGGPPALEKPRWLRDGHCVRRGHGAFAHHSTSHLVMQRHGMRARWLDGCGNSGRRIEIDERIICRADGFTCSMDPLREV